MQNYCRPIILNCPQEINDFLYSGLKQFKNEIFLFIEKNKDDRILEYANEQIFASTLM